MMNQDSKQLSLFANESESANFFNRKREWSASKHRIMLKYIQSFCYNLGGDNIYQSKILNYVDGFAGEGKYEQGIGIKNFIENSKFWNKHKDLFLDTDGSPLIALKCASIFQEENRVNLRCFFSEADKKANKALTRNCQEMKNVNSNLEYKIYPHQPFSDSFSIIMEELKEYPTLFFLDAFAVKGLNFSEIINICNYLSRYKGELFLLFNNSAVARNAGQLSPKSNRESVIKDGNTYTQNLTQLLGQSSEREWKNKWQELKDYPQEFEKWALEHFKFKLKTNSSIKEVKSFEIKKSYDDTRPQYSIVVCSNHPPKAFGELLNDFIAEENRLLFYKESNNNIEKFLDSEWNKEENRRQKFIKDIAVNFLEDYRPKLITIDDAITHLILKSDELGYLKRKEYKKIIDELYTEGKFYAEEFGKKHQLTLKSKIRVV